MFLNYIHILLIIVFANSLCLEAHKYRRYRFIVKEASYKKLCEKKTILTVNGKFPGPTLRVHKGETIVVDVYNHGKYNITIHWHGVKQPRYPWTDGPGYITQCPIQPGNKFSQKIIFSDEEGTLWWHAHTDWSRATVHGAIIIYPKPGTYYRFPQPRAEYPIILGQWWKEDVMKVYNDFVASGGQPNASDAYTMNGHPGDLYPCSNKHDTYKMKVKYGETYLLRIINAEINEIMFFAITKHNLTVVAIDASYIKPLTRSYIVIAPGQTMDCLLHANQDPSRNYYMAASAFVNGPGIVFDNSTTSAILNYENAPNHHPPSDLPYLPSYNDTSAALNFTSSVRSLNSQSHPALVPSKINKRIITTIALNDFPCPANQTCEGQGGTRILAASMSNISFVRPQIDILEAYYHRIPGVFGENFPDSPPNAYNYTSVVVPPEVLIAMREAQVKLIKYNSNIEVVFQGTGNGDGIDHPMHLHGYSFYVVGWGIGNFDEKKDPLNYNLVDPPHLNTVNVPRLGWAAIRFKADNPGVWFLHCHFERHQTWGMSTVFIVTRGEGPNERVLPPPPDMPPC